MAGTDVLDCGSIGDRVVWLQRSDQSIYNKAIFKADALLFVLIDSF